MLSTPPPREVSVESLAKPAKFVIGIVIGVASIGSAAAATYYGLTGQLERVVVRTEQVANQVEQVAESAKRGLEREREDRERGDSQLSVSVSALGRAQSDADKKLIVLEERLSAIGNTMDRMDRRQELLLERLNASPRPRSLARDYPQ